MTYCHFSPIRLGHLYPLYHEGAKYEDYNDFANPMKVALEARRKNKSGRWIFVCDGEKALYKG